MSPAAEVDDAFTAIEAALGPVQVLVSNAGITRDKLLLRMSEERLHLGDRHQPDRRVPRGQAGGSGHDGARGRIILVSSVVGLTGQAGQANYAASKAGLVGFARSLAREGQPQHHRQHRGPRSDRHRHDRSCPTTQATDVARVPLGRFGTPEEVAAVVDFLASAEAAYITGAVIPVDGGLGMGHSLHEPSTRKEHHVDDELFDRFRKCAVDVLSVPKTRSCLKPSSPTTSKPTASTSSRW